MKITHHSPASHFSEAFAIGNGHIGGMIYGETGTDLIELCENTFIQSSKNSNEIRHKNERNVPVGKLLISRLNYNKDKNTDTDIHKTNHMNGEVITDYERSLDIETGLVQSTYQINDNQFKTQSFASHVHKLLAYKITSEEKDMNITLSFQPSRQEDYVRYHIGGIFFVCQAHEGINSDAATGTLLCGKVSIYTDGFPQAKEDGVVIRNASSVTVYVTTITDFGEPELEKEKQILELQMKMNRYFVRVEDNSYEEILASHIADMKALHSRVHLAIEGQPLIEQMFQMGRYLLYSSVREDSRLPAHLQGIWYQKPEHSIESVDNTYLSIHTQMNYWPAEITNLPETTKSLFRRAEQEAICKISPSPTAGMWVINQMWEHYLISLDRKFLRERAFPVIENMVKFFSGYLCEDRTTQNSNCDTYNSSKMKELFDIYLKSCRILKRNNKLSRKTAEHIERLQRSQIIADSTTVNASPDYPAAEAIESLITASKCGNSGCTSLAQMLYEIRLGYSEKVNEHICSLSDTLLEPNGFISHATDITMDRGSALIDNTYELSGNTALTACIAQMLMQSHDKVLSILPCLPTQWKKGMVKGLIAPGNISVDISWDHGGCKVWMTAKKNTICITSYKGVKKKVRLKEAKPELVWND